MAQASLVVSGAYTTPASEAGGVYRRRLLVALATLATGTAGCTDRPVGETPQSTDSGGPRIVDRTFSADDGVCGVGPDAATVTFEADAVRVDGRLVAPTPCHGATLARAVVEDDSLTVAVARTESTVDACVQCRGEVPYEAVVRFADELPTAVEVEHDSQPVTSATR